MERRRLLRASVLLLVLQVGYARAESAFPNRYAKAAECSLQGMEAAGSGLDDACQLKSALGTGAPFGLTKGDGERLLVRAGETNCTVTLTKCRTDVCYTIRDAATSELPTSLSPLGGGPGIFASVDAISGVSGTGLTLSDYGVAFAPRESTVVLRCVRATPTCTRECRNHALTRATRPTQRPQVFDEAVR